MKVTFCAYDNPAFVSGPNTWLRRLLPSLCCLGIESRVLIIATSSDEGALAAGVRREGVAYDQIRWPEYSEQRIRWILTRLAADPPDVFVPNLMVPAYYASRWVRAAGVPTVGVLHSDDAFHRALLQEFVFGRSAYRL